MKILKTEDLKKYYGNKENEVHALNGVNFYVEEGEFVSIVGTSGSGKSTLMKMITGWVQPDAGTVEIGQTVKLGYFSQESEDMDGSCRVIDYIRDVAEYVKT